MKISIITVAYKNSRVVIDLLNSIQKYNDIGSDLEVIVVDNSPVDERIEKDLLSTEYKTYKYATSDNRGFGAGNNIGAELSCGEILAFLNPDTVLIKPIFRKIIEEFANNNRLVWLGGQLLDVHKNKISSFGRRFEYVPCSLLETIKCKLGEKISGFNSNKMYLNGADIFIKRNVFEKTGKFDENIFMFHEESDLMQRISLIYPDGIFRFCKDIKIIHLEGHAIVHFSEQAMQRDVESSIYYCKKYGFDYEKIYADLYEYNRRWLFIDRIFRPQIANRRERYLATICKQLIYASERKKDKTHL